MEAPKLQANWQAVDDPSSGRTYFYNVETRETRWEPPLLQPPPPVPLMLPQPPVPAAASNLHEGMNFAMQPSSSIMPPTQSLAAQSLVDKTRNVCNSIAADPKKALEIEISALAAGEIADLCFLQKQEQKYEESSKNSNDGLSFTPYQPINPFRIHHASNRAPSEPARIDQRMLQLEQQLERIERE